MSFSLRSDLTWIYCVFVQLKKEQKHESPTVRIFRKEVSRDFEKQPNITTAKTTTTAAISSSFDS